MAVRPEKPTAPWRAAVRNQSRARLLRHEMTPPEKALWRRLRRAPFEEAHFRRQHPIGSYIVDFCSVSARLVIELDGDSHDDQVAYDNRRTAWLERQGYVVLRFTNVDIGEELGGVLKTIGRALANRPPP